MTMLGILAFCGLLLLLCVCAACALDYVSSCFDEWESEE